MREERKHWKFFVNLIESSCPSIIADPKFFRDTFRTYHIWNRDTGKLEASYKVSDIAAFIAERIREEIKH